MNKVQRIALGTVLGQVAAQALLHGLGRASEQSVADSCQRVAELVEAMIEEAREGK